MDAEAVLGLRSALEEYLGEFDECMGQSTNPAHLLTYVSGQLGPLERKSIEPIADAAGMSPRTLQAFVGLYDWDHDMLRDKHQRRVARMHHDDAAIVSLDGTTFPKKGRKTVGVQPQHCGSLGKLANCVSSVFLGYSTPTLSTLIDGEVYLPKETWCEDAARRREAGIPDGVVFRTKPRIALDMLARARGNGLNPLWLVFDSEYGGNLPFLHELDAKGQRFIGEVPITFRVWTKEPRTRSRHHPCDQRGMETAATDEEAAIDGRDPAGPPEGADGGKVRLMVQTNPTSEVQMVLAHSPLVRAQKWVGYEVFESTKGPQVWEAIRLKVHLKKADGSPTRAYHLVIARSVLIRGEIKFFISNAPESTPVEDLLFVAFSRWRVERLFADTKGELGMDHFEVRKYKAVQRHLVMSCVSHTFLVENWKRHRGEKTGTDRVPDPHGHEQVGAAVERRRAVYAQTG